jgi:thiamine-monophosphate kinase
MSEKRTEIGTLGEFGLIHQLTKDYRPSQPSTVKGIGDDGAVIDNGKYLTVVSTDLLIEGIHFDLAYSPLKHLGYKAVVVNLSDIYAMNATPKQITVSLALSNRFSVEATEELYEGIYAACKHYGVDVVGGDTTSSRSGLIISITAIGQGEKHKLVYRNGAKQGDLICITGCRRSVFGFADFGAGKTVVFERCSYSARLRRAKILDRQTIKARSAQRYD